VVVGGTIMACSGLVRPLTRSAPQEAQGISAGSLHMPHGARSTEAGAAET